MRSRNGNSYFSRTVQVTLLLLYSFALQADEYLISYRYLVKDTILYNETLQISKAMQKCSGYPHKYLILETRDDKNLKEIINQNNQEFIEYLHKLGLNVVHNSKTSNYQYSETTILTLKTSCFKVDFNDNSVKISALK